MPKTGGISIERHISLLFGSHNVFYPKKRKRWFADFFLGSKIAATGTAENAHIIGHFAPFSVMRDREEEYYKVCFWRHPADWYLSFYNYRHRRNAARLKRQFTFGDFQRSMLRNPMTEYLLLYCGGLPGFTYFFKSDLAKFEAACGLVAKFDYFADIAKVDDFLSAVGIREGQKPKAHNRTPSDQKTLSQLDKTARRTIEHANPIDFYLHRLALGEDHEQVYNEAGRMLRSSFDASDILRLAALPYYRFKTWVLPFLPTLGSLAPKPARVAPRAPAAGADQPIAGKP
jgi:hypothetical protein